jgi:hypothetical protein
MNEIRRKQLPSSPAKGIRNRKCEKMKTTEDGYRMHAV